MLDGEKENIFEAYNMFRGGAIKCMGYQDLKEKEKPFNISHCNTPESLFPYKGSATETKDKVNDYFHFIIKLNATDKLLVACLKRKTYVIVFLSCGFVSG